MIVGRLNLIKPGKSFGKKLMEEPAMTGLGRSRKSCLAALSLPASRPLMEPVGTMSWF